MSKEKEESNWYGLGDLITRRRDNDVAALLKNLSARVSDVKTNADVSYFEVVRC